MRTIEKVRSSASDIIGNTVRDYISPIYSPVKARESSSKERINDLRDELSEVMKENKSLNNSLAEAQRKYDSLGKAFNLINKAVCYNQGELIQYIYRSTEKHKVLKEIYRKYNSGKCSCVGSEKISIDDIDKGFDDLYAYIRDEFHKVTSVNFELLRKYFDGRDAVEPRITVKGKSTRNGKEFLIPLIRNHDAPYSSETSIDVSTAYDHIRNTGKYYLQNNIPRAAAEGAYKNARLDFDKIKQLLTPFVNTDEDRFIRNVESGWQDCWLNSEFKQQEDDRRYYKSTLIIPITLHYNDLDDQFVYSLNEKIVNTDINSESIERTIFGFLCFDHIKSGYFNEQQDVSVGYSFADMISLYLFMRTMLLEVSGTFTSIYKTLKENGRVKNLDPYTYGPYEKMIIDDEFNDSPKYTESSNNYIQDIFKLEAESDII